MRPGDSASVGADVLRRMGHIGRRLGRGGAVEAAVWTIGLLAMVTMDPQGEHLFSLCPLNAAGVTFCPGCGLGHAIAYLARGAVVESIRAHPLGIPAVLLLVTHIGRLVRGAFEIDAHLHNS